MTEAIFCEGKEQKILQDYWMLTKPRVMTLVLFTAMVGMLCVPDSGEWGLRVISLFAIALGAGASGAFNMAWEGEVDALMERTSLRPVAAGRVSPEEAVTFAGFLAFVSLLLLELSAGWEASLLLAFTIFFYAGVYTRILKFRTPQNIVIGGLAGALPPVIGWVAGGGALIPHRASDWLPWILCGVILLWTPPHFWALCLLKEKDYARTPWLMYPQVYGVKRTQGAIGIYSAATSLFSLLPWAVTPPHLLWTLSGVGCLALNGFFCFKGWDLMRALDPFPKCASFFLSSILYLFLYFLCVLGVLP